VKKANAGAISNEDRVCGCVFLCPVSMKSEIQNSVEVLVLPL